MISFTVIGEPIPQGSSKAISLPGHNYSTIVSSNPKLSSWRRQVRASARAVSAGFASCGLDEPAGKAVPLLVKVAFYFEKPKSVKRSEVTVPPDLDKLVRAVLDGMTGVLYVDDAQVVEIAASKHYGMPPRAEIEVSEVGIVQTAMLRQPILDKDLPF